jgi:radical SAM superfamily enzyme YgiQ (UPF0313 family)
MRALLFNVTEHSYIVRSLGVHRIAHVLRQQGIDVEVIDWANHWSLEQLNEFYLSRDPKTLDFIGFSKLFNHWPEKMELFCSFIKKHNPGIPIISGSQVNPHFDTKLIDYYIQGWGEHAILVLLSWLFSNGPKPRFLLNARGKKIIPANDFYPAYPMPDLMVRYEDRDFIQPDEWLNIETARGCKFACAFCNYPALGVKNDSTRDSANFKEQLLDAYERFGVTNYIVTDDTFNDSTEKITKFADAVESLSFLPAFSGAIRADLLIKRPADRIELARMNFIGHYYGIESFQKNANKSVGKGMDKDRLQDGLIEVKNFFESHGQGLYRASLSLIVGLPGDTEKDMENTQGWLKQNWTTQAFTVYPLFIPRGTWDKPSKFSENYQKYGYTEIKNETSTKLKQEELYGIVEEDLVLWKNLDMNFFDAKKIVDDFISLKYQHDFRVSNYTLSMRLTDSHKLTEKINLDYKTFSSKKDPNIDFYIQKKLSN